MPSLTSKQRISDKMKKGSKLLSLALSAFLAFAAVSCSADEKAEDPKTAENDAVTIQNAVDDENLASPDGVSFDTASETVSSEFIDNTWAAFLVSPSHPAYTSSDDGYKILDVLCNDSVIGSVASKSRDAAAPAPTTAYGADVITAGGPVSTSSLANGKLSEIPDSFLNAMVAQMKADIGDMYGDHDGGSGMGYRTFYQASYDVDTGGLQVNQENGYWARTLGAYSEHCAGVAVDFNISYDNSQFLESNGSGNRGDDTSANKEFTWLADNAHKYGFIWRYKIDGNTTSALGNRTGTISEGWHWRFVGVYNATKFWEKCAGDSNADGIPDKGYMTNDNYIWEDYYQEYIENNPAYPHSELEAFTQFYNSTSGNKCTYEEYIFR